MSDEDDKSDSGKAAITSLMLDMLGPAAKEVGELLGDHVRYFRWRSGVWTLKRAKRKVVERGEPLRSVPIKFLVPFVEKASLEDEGSPLSECWAELLANAATNYSSRYIQYAEILSKISHREATILQHMYDRAAASGTLNYLIGESSKDSIFPRMSLDMFERGEASHIAMNHPLRPIDQDRVASSGILFVHDRLDVPGDLGQSFRGVLAPDPGYDIIEVVDGLEKLGLVFHYAVGRAFQDGSKYECRWAQLQRFGIGFIKAVTPTSATLESGVNGE